MERVVVVGGGLAGLRTTVALREGGFAGELVLLGAESRAPYDRPPLSKAVLMGAAETSELEADWRGLDVRLLLGRRATAVAREGVLETDAGPLDFDALVLACGGAPVRWPGTGSALTLRTHEDALLLRSRLAPGTRLVVVGAGWIGAEVATAATAAGVDVTVVEALDAPLASALPAECGQRTLPWWSGVDLRLGAVVDAVEPDGVHLRGGERLPADVVLLAVGSRPATDWLTGSAVQLVDRGAVAVDGALRTSAPRVWAVGDCAAWASERYGARMHVEHWDHALHSPSVAAANVLGGDQTYDPVPYFWSEQWGRMLQYAGHHPSAERTVWRDANDGTWGAFWLSGDRLVAALTADRPRDLLQARRLMERGAAVDADRLRDPSVPVKQVAG